ncbi:unnamed protein product [Arctogadus glacialis]
MKPRSEEVFETIRWLLTACAKSWIAERSEIQGPPTTSAGDAVQKGITTIWAPHSRIFSERLEKNVSNKFRKFKSHRFSSSRQHHLFNSLSSTLFRQHHLFNSLSSTLFRQHHLFNSLSTTSLTPSAPPL